MNDRAISKHSYALGRYCFRLESCNEQHLQLVEFAFKSARSQNDGEIDLLDISGKMQTLGEAIDIIRDSCYEQHVGELYIEGCAFLTTRQHRVLLLGLSHAGKSTVAVAAALALNWKLVAEDTVIIDAGKGVALSTPAPLSLRKTAPELIAEATGHSPEPLLDGRWFPANGHFLGHEFPSAFDLTVILVRDGDGQMEATENTPEKILRHALTLSNALHVNDGCSRLYECVRNSKCLIIRNGSVKERLRLFDELDQQLHSSSGMVSRLVPA